jgi:hypothetical protein
MILIIMSGYGPMSYSNMNMLLDSMGSIDYRNQVTAFGNWTGVGLVIVDTSDPDNPRFSVLPVYGSIPPVQLSP